FGGKYESWRERLFPDDLAGSEAAIQRSLTTGEFVTDFRVVWPDGSVRWLHARAQVFFSEDGSPLRMVGVNMDIDDRKRAEEEVRLLNSELETRVASRTSELERANREMEAFSYSVSHDLRAPLRSIDGFTRILEEDHGAKLDDEARRCLGRILSASERMGRLIDDMLKLSRVSRGELVREDLHLSDMVASIVATLRERDPGRSVTVVVAPGVQASADSRLVQVALENLLDNAFKFTSKKPESRIEFGSGREGGEQHFFVRDDGAGFDPAYAGKLFGAFQRLHPEAEFPGTGIGLATVQRVVQRHGGRVWAEGETGRGAAFYFTLGRGTP
ncbi:MAG: ATP-binding protein, partial [Acidobacteriota bacterium]